MASWLLSKSTFAIYVTEGSPCQSLCGNVLRDTTPRDVVCKEDEYASSAPGIVFQQCTTCQLTSNYVSGPESDLQWLLYNLRYAVSYCIYGYPENDEVTSSPCLTSTACEPLQLAITYQNLAPNSTIYGFCQTWIHDQMPRCAACLRAGGEHYLTNFMTILNGACEQTPAAGRTVSLEGSPFSRTAVNITDPVPVATDLPNYYPGPLGLNERVGIAFGGLSLILMVTGIIIICRGRKRRRAFLKNMESSMKQGRGGWPAPINTNAGPAAGGYFDSPEGGQKPFRGWDDTPVSQRPLRDWDNSPQSTNTEKFQGRYFSPYSSQYNSPDTAVENRQMVWPTDKLQPQTKVREIGVALSGPEPSPVWNDTKGKEGIESYELREVEIEQGVPRSTTKPEVQAIYPPGKPVYAHYYPEDHMDSPEDRYNGGKGW